jgi:hypothetical protein
MSSVIGQMAFLRTRDPALNMSRAVQLYGILATAKEAADRYRTAVLHHDDLARRIGYQRPESWNGHVPPRTDGYGEYNSSPYRAALVAVVIEALTRDNDWRHYDSDRLASVPASKIRAPWAETSPHLEAGLWPESGP